MNSLLLRRSIRDAAGVSFSRSGGPGGQNVNKVNTKVTLRLPITGLRGLLDVELGRVRELLTNRITINDEMVIASDEERSQRANLERAYFRLEALIVSAARIPKHRRPTKPSQTVREHRLKSKKLHGQKKKNRQLDTTE